MPDKILKHWERRRLAGFHFYAGETPGLSSVAKGEDGRSQCVPLIYWTGQVLGYVNGEYLQTRSMSPKSLLNRPTVTCHGFT